MPSQPPASRIKPPALHPGDSIGMAAPASSFKRKDFEAGCEALRRMGYTPVFNESIFAHDLYFAGSVERRARELEEMFLREDVSAILCARGGYGSNYLLPELNLRNISAHPKIFIGYSDNTMLLTYFSDAASLITFHGPMLDKDFARTDALHVESMGLILEGIKKLNFVKHICYK